MASSHNKSIFIFIALFVVLSFMIVKQASTTDDFSAARRIHNRKVVLIGLREKIKVVSYGNGGKSLNDLEALRKIPSGPDPLHHNGNNKKKPRTP
ncbi:hypothetical protein G4B88_003010 [Cannabis sativa]|uniref:Uncharacterized protein n=1 Tax=Cannabis sativa TaxID=3483 RepID=A0A7J6FK50_CANSA|nr:hypothetical protein G4B88_003010 [Cannabis sativa]